MKGGKMIEKYMELKGELEGILGSKYNVSVDQQKVKVGEKEEQEVDVTLLTATPNEGSSGYQVATLDESITKISVFGEKPLAERVLGKVGDGYGGIVASEKGDAVFYIKTASGKYTYRAIAKEGKNIENEEPKEGSLRDIMAGLGGAKYRVDVEPLPQKAEGSYSTITGLAKEISREIRYR